MEDKYNNDFPYYRKMSNNKSFYKIIDDKTFEEIQLIGSSKKHYIHNAKQYPEMLRIHDMINLNEGYFLELTENEWDLLIPFE